MELNNSTFWSSSTKFTQSKIDSDSDSDSSGNKEHGKCPNCGGIYEVEDENIYPYCTVECKYAEMEL